MTSDKLLRQLDGGKPPCLSFCSEVISRCIGRENLDTLSNSWKSHVSLLMELAKMVNGRYNIVNIITSIDVQISEAIMNFQENAANITQSVFEACSKEPKGASPGALMPLHNRISRRAAGGSLAANSARRNVHQAGAGANEHQFEMASSFERRFEAFALPSSGRAQPHTKPSLGSSLLGGISERPLAVIDEIRAYMLSIKSFWSGLPNAVCTSNQTLSTAAASLQPGGNPVGLSARAKNSASSNCFSEQLAIWHMNSDLRYTLEINQIIERFKSMEAKIRDALAGREVDWSIAPNQRAALNNNSALAANTRPPIVTYPTTTTVSTTPEDDTEDPGDDALDPLEPGSGSANYESDTDITDSDEADVGQEDPTTDESESSEFAPEPAKEDNTIDSKPSDYVPDNPGGFITVDPSPRKSSASTSVMTNNQLPLASLFSLCALSVVNILLTNHYQFSFDRRTLLARL